MARIAVVEDDEDILRLLAMRLKRAGHEVSTAIDGVDGWELVRAVSPELIVLDWMMPRMNGLDLCHTVRADPQFASVRILMLTAKTQPHDMERALAAGADDYLMKPFTSQDFADRVGRLLSA